MDNLIYDFTTVNIVYRPKLILYLKLSRMIFMNFLFVFLFETFALQKSTHAMRNNTRCYSVWQQDF